MAVLFYMYFRPGTEMYLTTDTQQKYC